jgi:hypothetical protein
MLCFPSIVILLLSLSIITLLIILFSSTPNRHFTLVLKYPLSMSIPYDATFITYKLRYCGRTHVLPKKSRSETESVNQNIGDSHYNWLEQHDSHFPSINESHCMLMVPAIRLPLAVNFTNTSQGLWLRKWPCRNIRNYLLWDLLHTEDKA